MSYDYKMLNVIRIEIGLVSSVSIMLSTVLFMVNKNVGSIGLIHHCGSWGLISL